MKKSEAIEHFGGQVALAKALKVSQPAVSKWPELVPDGHAARLEKITKGELVYSPEMYELENESSSNCA